jgi:rhodanese-related sulfurtransferase
MKLIKPFFTILALSLLSILFQAQSCQEEPGENTVDSTAGAEELSPQLFYQMLENKKGILIDLRIPAEYDSAHIQGAINLDIMSDNFKPAINRLNKQEIYYLYCTSGSSSHIAADYMHLLGLRAIYILRGGIIEWKAQNYRTVPEPGKLEDKL